MARNIIAGDKDTSDPYLKFTFPDKETYETTTIDKTLNPVWNKKFT